MSLSQLQPDSLAPLFPRRSHTAVLLAGLCGVLALPGSARAREKASIGAQVQATWTLRAHRLDAEAPVIPARDYARAAEGERRTGLIPGSDEGPGHAWGVMIVPTSIDRVWAALNDEPTAARRQSGRASKVLTGRPCDSGRVVLSIADVPAVKDRWWRVEMIENRALHRASDGELRELRWRPAPPPAEERAPELAARIAESEEVVDPEGAWLLLSLGPDRTLVEYHAATTIEGTVPAWLIHRVLRSSLNRTLGQVRDFALAGESRCI